MPGRRRPGSLGKVLPLLTTVLDDNGLRDSPGVDGLDLLSFCLRDLGGCSPTCLRIGERNPGLPARPAVRV
jgi:hypothetical protein